MYYDLSNPTDLKSAQSRWDFLVAKQKRINLSEKRRKRTYSQNRYLHLLLGWFALETGYTLSEAKHIYKMMSKVIFVYTKKGIKFVKSSADIDTKQMTITIERFRNYSNDTAGIYLPSPNETEFLNNIENQMSKYENKIYI